MAKLNHLLDNKIVVSAFAEFMEKGYQDASLRKIAQKAGVTVGALYTRYKTKDNMFCSLLEPLTTEISAAFKTLKSSYYTANKKDLLQNLNNSMKEESNMILHLIFDKYDMAILLLCRSNGSSLEHFFDKLIDRKVHESICFFEKFHVKKIDKNLLQILIAAQFNSYYQIISNRYDAKEAKRCIKATMKYHLGGWTALLNWFQIEMEE